LDPRLQARIVLPANFSESQLPEGYHCEEGRKCRFLVDFDIMSSGFPGLGLAIFMKAVEDGCNPDWLKLLKEFYEIKVPSKALDRKPAARLRYCSKKDEMIATSERKKESDRLRLKWEDGVAGTTPFAAAH
jgi:hypothetical protein